MKLHSKSNKKKRLVESDEEDDHSTVPIRPNGTKSNGEAAQAANGADVKGETLSCAT